MIGEIKGMIAGCIEQMRQQACGTCERRDTCSFVVPELIGALFSPVSATAHRASRGERVGRALFDLLKRAAGEAHKPPTPAREPTKEAPAAAGSLRREVEHAVAPLLADGPVRIEAVARRLGYSRQTLYRRLKAEGITYERLVDDLRRRKALQLVSAGELSIKQISHRLGFSDPAAFAHAFKRWTGRSARDMRGQPG